MQKKTLQLIEIKNIYHSKCSVRYFNKAGRTRRDFSRPIFVDRLNRYVCGINLEAILLGQYQTVLILHQYMNRLKSVD